MTIYVAVQCGEGKEQSEDTVLVGESLICDGIKEFSMPANGTICVADGVGGNTGGNMASTFVAEKFKTLTALEPDINATKIQKRLAEINAELIYYGQKNGFPTMATTLTGLVYFGIGKYLVHIGNTRAYVLQGNYLKQLTTDHTVYNRLLKMGRIDEASQCRKNEITNCLGGGNTKLFESLCILEVQEFHTLILTSDGVHDFLSLDELESLLTADTIDITACSNIVQAAIRAGSKDDLSVVIIKK